MQPRVPQMNSSVAYVIIGQVNAQTSAIPGRLSGWLGGWVAAWVAGWLPGWLGGCPASWLNRFRQLGSPANTWYHC